MVSNSRKSELSGETTRRCIVLRLRAGVHRILHDKRAWAGVTAYLLLALAFSFYNDYAKLNGNSFNAVARAFTSTIFVPVVLFGLLCYIVAVGTPKGARRIQNNLARIGFTNSAGEVPILLNAYPYRAKNGSREVQVPEFLACGLAKSVWEDKQVEIAAALNVNIAKIEESCGKLNMRLYTTPAEDGLPDKLDWHDSLLNYESPECKVVLGESLLQPVMTDFNVCPHMLIGGGTGSGKTVLLRCILMQLLRKAGTKVTIADFKGGVDFSAVWHNHPNCKMIFNRAKLADYLDGLVAELNRRKEIIAQADRCCNIYDYNNRCALYLDRIFFAVDKVAEILDKTGLDKADKELVARIERSIATIARLGRAFGIHLILATQRPDANILSGQIKNNIAYRVCGRADNVLSMIILDNTSAADQIPADARGRFIDSDGTVFQGYWFDESILGDWL